MRATTQKSKRPNSISVLLIVCILAVFSCGGGGGSGSDPVSYTYESPAQTNDGLQTASLEEGDLDESLITRAVERILNSGYGIVNSFLIVRDGKLVLEAYFGEYDHHTQDPVYSVTKSITSTLIGIAIDRGDIESVDEALFDFFPEYSNFENSMKSQITIQHLLSMTSGLSWKDSDWVEVKKQSDPVGYILSRSAVASPGVVYEYSEGNMILLGEIIKKVSNLNMQAYLTQHLFDPLGIQSFELSTIGSTSSYNAGAGISMRPRDMAKVGLLFLQNGVWDGEVIVSEEWVSTATKKHSDGSIKGCYGYGYNWWLKKWQANSQSYDSYLALGWGGDTIIVLPSLEMVVVFTCGDYDYDADTDVSEVIVPNYVLPAVRE